MAICPGGPSHWSFGGGMLWLSGHWEWHALAAYVVFPLRGRADARSTRMGGTHIEATRRATAAALSDVRSSRNGRYGEVMVERIKELGLERGRIGLLEIDSRHKDYLPVNQYNDLRRACPRRSSSSPSGIMHELLSVHSEEELDCIRHAGKLCTNAMQAIADRARPGVDRIPAERRGGRRHPGGRRRHRLPHHRLDADGRPGAGLRQSAPVLRAS